MTTDGVYRETIGTLPKFRKMSVLRVNMETSELHAVAKHKSVEIASAYVISDLLTEWLLRLLQKLKDIVQRIHYFSLAGVNS